MSWSAAQYTKFEAERTRPVRDLLAALPDGPANLAIDLGCGPGNSTERLAAKLPGATIIGVDSSTDMIAAARQRLPHITFETADLAAWTPPAAPDVILANAVLQWLPDHETLFPALIAHLAEGGHLAVQMPDNLDEPAHRLMRDIAAEGPWAKRLTGAAGQRTRMASAEAYYEILRPHCAHIDLWRTTYYHALTGGAPAVVEWFMGSGLRPFLAPLDEALRAGFLERYTEAISRAYPALADGNVLLPFPRLFLVGSK